MKHIEINLEGVYKVTHCPVSTLGTIFLNNENQKVKTVFPILKVIIFFFPDLHINCMHNCG